MQWRRHTPLRFSCTIAAFGALIAAVACGGGARSPVQQVADAAPVPLAPFPIQVARLASATGALITAAPVAPVADGVSHLVPSPMPDFTGMWHAMLGDDAA